MNRNTLSNIRTWVAALAFLAVMSPTGQAADHFDSPLAKRDARKDITDVYAFRSPANAANLVVVLNVSPHTPGAPTVPLFSDSALYNIHVDNNGDLTPDATVEVTFSGSDPQTFKVTGLGSTINGQVGVTKTVGSISIFCGPRDDPFFFDLDVFKMFLAGPYIPAQGLRDAAHPPPADHFAGQNVASIIIELPVTTLTGLSSPNMGTIKTWATIWEPESPGMGTAARVVGGR